MRSISSAPDISREAFVQNLSDSGLLSADEIQKVLHAIPAGPGFNDSSSVVQQLIDSGRLTSYQAEALRDRRFHELKIGNYEVLDRLGAGGMGTVFRARHRRMKRIVALKVLSREVAQSESFIARFQREVETIAKLSHPNIVMAFDADEAEIGHILVMEFVNGRDLASEVQKNGPLSVALAVNYIIQAASGLEYAHQQGIIHRDIKPANLLRDVAGTIKVADLGLARLSGGGQMEGNSALTQTGGIVGTMDYMPPEQALDATSIDLRADIYSLGGTLFFLLAGRPPFVANSLMALLLKHSTAAIPSLCDVRPGVPRELDAIFHKMLAKKPDERYQSMTELIKALEAVKGFVVAADSPPPAAAATGTADSQPNLTGPTVAADSVEALMAMASPSPVSIATSSPAPASAGIPTPSEVRRVSDLTIVLVEPSRTQAGIIRKYLQQLGIEKVHSTGSAQQAIALVKQHQANTILSAMHINDMNGVLLGQALRGDAECAGVGFVLMTSESDMHEAQALLDTPHTVLLQKPFDLRKLAHALALATGRMEESLLPRP